MKTIRLDSIKSNERNPRQITPEQFQKLMQSISDLPAMMELRPIIVDADGVILGGNMRHKALLQMGMVEVPETWVRKADSLTKEDKRRFIIADNIGFGEWDMDILSADYDLPELEAWGLSLEGVTLIDRPDGDAAGASPWDRVGDASDGVMFSFGTIQKRVPTELFEAFSQSVGVDNLEEWIREAIRH